MVSVNKIGDSITGSIKGKVFGLAYTAEKLKQLQDLAMAAENAATVDEYNAVVGAFLLLTQEDFTTTVETACPNIHINKSTGKFYLKQGDVLSVHAMPKSFANRILESLEKGLDITPMIKAWTRFLRNPYFSPAKAKKFTNYLAMTFVDSEVVNMLMNDHGVSHEVAVERATTLQTPLTQEGLVCSYKVSREVFDKFALDEKGNKITVPRYTVTKTINEDTGEITTDTGLPAFVEERVFEPAIMGTKGDAFYCGDVLGHQIKVGQRHYLADWDQVNTDDYQSGVKGLHIGGLDYIKNISGQTHLVFFDPMYLGAIPNDSTGAVRVKEYFLYDSMVGPVKSLYHSSTYAALTDAAWEVLRLEAIEKSNKVKVEQEAVVAGLAV